MLTGSWRVSDCDGWPAVMDNLYQARIIQRMRYGQLLARASSHHAEVSNSLLEHVVSVLASAHDKVSTFRKGVVGCLPGCAR